jgi:hypothetical protein
MGASRTSLAWGRIRDVFVVEGKNGGGYTQGVGAGEFQEGELDIRTRAEKDTDAHTEGDDVYKPASDAATPAYGHPLNALRNNGDARKEDEGELLMSALSGDGVSVGGGVSRSGGGVGGSHTSHRIEGRKTGVFRSECLQGSECLQADVGGRDIERDKMSNVAADATQPEGRGILDLDLQLSAAGPAYSQEGQQLNARQQLEPEQLVHEPIKALATPAYTSGLPSVSDVTMPSTTSHPHSAAPSLQRHPSPLSPGGGVEGGGGGVRLWGALSELCSGSTARLTRARHTSPLSQVGREAEP